MNKQQRGESPYRFYKVLRLLGANHEHWNTTALKMRSSPGFGTHLGQISLKSTPNKTGEFGATVPFTITCCIFKLKY